MKRRRTQNSTTDEEPAESDTSGNANKSSRSSTALCQRESHKQAERRRAERVRNEFNRLQGILTQSGKSTKQDKRSVLANAAGYIQELEKELAAYRQPPSIRQIGPADYPCKSAIAEHEQTFDYESVFLANGIPQAIATLNGRFIDCNAMFCWLSGYTKEELCTHSFYSLTPKWELSQSHALIGELLSQCNSSCSQIACSKVSRKHCIFKGGVAKLYVSVTLVRDEKGFPAHFICSVLPLIFTSTSAGSLFSIDKHGADVEVKQGIEDESDCLLEFIDTSPEVALDGRDGTGDSNSVDGTSSAFDTATRALSTQGDQEVLNTMTSQWPFSFDSTPISPTVSVENSRTLCKWATSSEAKE